MPPRTTGCNATVCLRSLLDRENICRRFVAARVGRRLADAARPDGDSRELAHPALRLGFSDCGLGRDLELRRGRSVRRATPRRALSVGRGGDREFMAPLARMAASGALNPAAA